MLSEFSDNCLPLKSFLSRVVVIVVGKAIFIYKLPENLYFNDRITIIIMKNSEEGDKGNQ